MAYRGYHYNGYRGRGRSVLKAIIAVLVVVLLLLLAALFLLENAQVFSGGGVHLGGLGQSSQTPQPENTEPLVVVTATPSPTPTPDPSLPAQAMTLPLSALTDGTAETQLTTAGASAAIFDMKGDDGSLGYVSALTLAAQGNANPSDEEINTAIETLNAGDIYTIARVSCFRDNTVPYYVPTLGVKTNSNYNWRDGGDYRWLSPTSDEVRQYVTDICVELARMGFDEIMLDNSAYPTTGHLEYIRKGDAYDAAQFETVVTNFYAQIKSALAAYPDVTLSIVTDSATLTAGVNATSGQSVAGMTANADRLWVELGETTLADVQTALGTQGVTLKEDELIPVVAAPGAAGTAWGVIQ